MGTNPSEILIKIQPFSDKNIDLKCRLQDGGYFDCALVC